MNNLTQKEIKVVSMKLWLDMTFEEIASAARISKAGGAQNIRAGAEKLEGSRSFKESLCAASKTLSYGGEQT